MYNPFNKIKSRYLFIFLVINLLIYFIFVEIYPILQEKLIEKMLITLVFYGTLYFYVTINLKRNKNYLKCLFLNTSNNIKFIDLTILTLILLAFSYGVIILEFYSLNFISPDLVIDLLKDETFLDSTKINNSYIYNSFSFIALIIIAPIVEEIVYRGFLINRFFIKWGIKKAVIISSLIFGICHADIIGSFIFGLFMSIVYLKTKNLWFSIYCHSLNNLVTGIITFLDFFYSENIEQNSSNFTKEDIFFSLALLSLSLPFIIKYLKKTDLEDLANFNYEKIS